MTIKVLIVDDMATYRSIIARSLAQIDGVEVVGKVSNGKKALEFLNNQKVDLITLDVEMPVMDGLATLKTLRDRNHRAEVVMVSGLSEQAASLTIKCLELGALDFVLKPQTDSFVENQIQLVESLKKIVANLSRPSANRRRLAPTKPRTATPRPASPLKKRSARGLLGRPKICLIGISTGGPRALAEVFEQLKGPLPFPIVIVQHMPPKFTASLAQNLDRKGPLSVVEAQDGDVLERDKAYIAPGGSHLVIMRDPDFGMLLATNQKPPVNSCRPSVDVLFESAAGFYRRGEVVCLIMTGMGKDGAIGAKTLSDKGAYVAIQSEQTSTIYGMPKSVEELGVQDEILDLQDIASFIMRVGQVHQGR